MNEVVTTEKKAFKHYRISEHLNQEIDHLAGELPDDFVFCVNTGSPLQIWRNKLHIWGEMPFGTEGKEQFYKTVEDIAELGVDTVIMGISMSEIIDPEFRKPIPAEIERYKRLFRNLRDHGVTNFIIKLDHFDLPQWMEDLGGWENRDNLKYWEEFVTLCVEEFTRFEPKIGEDPVTFVKDWIPTNEPNIFVANGYLAGMWPPSKRSLRAAKKAYKNLAEAHIMAAQIIRRHYEDQKEKYKDKPEVEIPEPRIGCALAIPDMRPGGIFPDRIANMPISSIFNKLTGKNITLKDLTDFVIKNGVIKSYKGESPIGLNYPINAWLFYDRIKEYVDYFGLQIYFPQEIGRSTIKEKTNMGWALDLTGNYIYNVLMEIHRRYPNKEIMITENGIALAEDFGENVEDSTRAKFTKASIQAIIRAIKDGVNIRRYSPWSIIPNWEFGDTRGNFGLFDIDEKTREHIKTAGGAFYEAIVKRFKAKKKEKETAETPEVPEEEKVVSY